jgi:uncharacterized protein YoxC
MADDLTKLAQDFSYFKKEWDQTKRDIEEMKKTLIDIATEVGVKQGYQLSEQMNDLADKLQYKLETLDHTARDTTASRKLLEYNETNVKEIMRALSLIYRSVDELEKKLLNEQETS